MINRKFHFNAIAKFFIGVFIMMNLVGCDKNNDDTFSPKLTVARESFDVSNSNSQYAIDVLSNKPWEAQSNVDWINLEITSGGNGRFNLSFSVVENDDDQRTGIITITIGGDTSREIVVNQEAGNTDDIFVVPNGSGDGLSWSKATNLANALNIAVSGNTIHIAEGTYVPSETITGGDPSDERDRTFEITRNITLVGGYPINATKDTESDPSNYTTILSGNDSSYHVVVVSASKDEGQKVGLHGLTISEGNAGSASTSTEINGVKFRRDYGGGVVIGNAIVNISDTRIIENKSEKFVAGIYAFEGSVVTMDNSEVSNNISVSNVGGIWVSESKMYISNSKILANEGGTGAGIHGYPDAEIYMNNSIVADNKGKSYGAGFYVRQNSIAILANCMITGNSSTSKNGGGGIMMYNNTKVTIISSTITDNSVPIGPGAGIYRRSGENVLNIYNSIISGNHQLVDGKDVDTYEADALPPKLESSTLGAMVFDQNGVDSNGITFNYNTMLQNLGDFVIVPVGENNPALIYGADLEELVRIGDRQDPKVEESIITSDLSHNSRTGLKIMGAFVNIN
ncbi:hypothetical protein KCTC52924_00710 [Arenibacter antarcticus]|uniref:BACON domain-containing protein n=1 Tax=Arenibacter antarcticus TaxID=2040469 RepID=A0ABW5VC17_9FLAO|nr:BACON domain-containing carbohydrate-binding protein [Arenibacter sp. H213]MCM4169229.1 hypothetical protein [Arenibacter sp. H213]